MTPSSRRRRELQSLHMVEPRSVCSSRAPAAAHPVIPLAGKALRQQDATAGHEGVSGTDCSLQPLSAVTAAVQLVPSSSISVICSCCRGAQAAQSHLERIRVSDVRSDGRRHDP